MGKVWTPKGKAIAAALAKRAARKASWGAAGAASIALGLAVAAGTVAAVTSFMMAVSCPWMPRAFGAWQAGREAWIAGGAWAALACWALFDAWRSPALFANANPWRPCASAMVVMGSGIYFMMDRMGQWLSPAGGLGLTAPFWPKRAAFEPSPAGSWAAAALDPWRESARWWGPTLRKWPEAAMCLAWGMASAGFAIALMPFAYAEMAAWALAGKAKSLGPSSLAKAARGYAEGLLAEGAPDFARREAGELGEGASAAEKSEPPPRL